MTELGDLTVPWNRFPGLYVHKFGLRARICKRLRSPGIDSYESIPPGTVAWRSSTITLFLLGTYPHRMFKNPSSGLSYRPARLGIDSWAPWKVYKYGLRERRHADMNHSINHILSQDFQSFKKSYFRVVFDLRENCQNPLKEGDCILYFGVSKV